MFYKTHETEVLKGIQETLGGGRMYVSNEGTDKSIVSFFTTRIDETIKLCEMLIPHLIIKKTQAEKLLCVCNLMRLRLDNSGKFRQKTTEIYTKEDMQKIIITATTMNKGLQSTRWRETKGRNTDYYLELVDKMYGQCNDTTRIMETLP